MALVGEDRRITEAHTEAVKAALDYAEASLVQTRRSISGEIVKQSGGKIIAGLFQHDSSRALDPQLHTHAVLTTIVKDTDGIYRTLHNDKVYKSTILLGRIYRNEFAQRLEQLGYGIDRGRDGLFEIQGVSRDLMDQFSKRSAEIKEALQNTGRAQTTKNSDLAALATRARKQPVERDELKAAWKSEVRSLGYDISQVLNEARRSPPTLIEDRSELATRAVDFAINHLAERNAVYSHASVIVAAVNFAPTVSVQAAEQELGFQAQAGVLYPVTRGGELHYTDVENVRLETENVDMTKGRSHRAVMDMRTAYQRNLTTRSSDSSVKKALADSALTVGQRDAAAMVLSSIGGVVGVQGYAGSGKTYMLETASRLAQSRGYAFDGIAPSHKAVTALADALPNSRTVQSLLTAHESGANLGDKTRSILVVDEASMLSSEGMNRILRMADNVGYARVALVGDIKQLEAVGAGSAFRQLQDAGMSVAAMTDIQRQRTDEGREAVLAAISGDIEKAFKGLSTVTEVGSNSLETDRLEIAEKLAAKYLSFSPEDRSQTGIVTLTNKMRHAVNDAIQNNLKETNALEGEGVKLDGLQTHGFTRAESAEIGSYLKGDIVVAPITTHNSPIEASTLYTVSRVDIDAKTLYLTSPDGIETSLEVTPQSRIASHLIALKEDQSTFYRSDMVKFRITDQENGVINSAEGQLVGITKDSLAVETKDGKVLAMPTDSLGAKGMELAYAATAHDFQGSTVDHVLLGMHSQERLTSQKAFYVGLSRMRFETELVTDDREKLATRIASETGDRVNALDALKEERERLEKEEEKARIEGRSPEASEGSKLAPDEASQDRANAVEKDLQSNRLKASETSPKDLDKADDERPSFETNMDKARANLEHAEQSIERDQKTRDERSR